MQLLTEYFRSTNDVRHSEYLTCLHNNIRNEYITKIHLFVSDDSSLPPQSEHAKIVVHRLSERPTYEQLFSFCNENLKDEICIITNADIIFDNTLSFITKDNIRGKFIALSRWDLLPGNKCQHYDLAYSQDVWIYLSPYNIVGGNYTMGILGCDNRITYDAYNSGLQVINPSKLIRTYHLHTSAHRTYSNNNVLKGDYLFVESTDSMDKESYTILTNTENIGKACMEVRKRKMQQI